MTRNLSDVMPSDKTTEVKKSPSEQITLWVGAVSAIVTISLTIWNAHTKWA